MEDLAEHAGWKEPRAIPTGTAEAHRRPEPLGGSLMELTHDARNMVTALELYCDLLEEPGVLTPEHAHFGHELKMVASASRRLVERLMHLDLEAGWSALDFSSASDALAGRNSSGGSAAPSIWHEHAMAEPILNLAAELEGKRNLLTALAGPGIAVTMEMQGGNLPVRLSREDLTRVLVNLVRNASEAMPGGGQITLRLDEFHSGSGDAAWLILRVDDTGPGIPLEVMKRVFEAGAAASIAEVPSGASGVLRGLHRGLGLSIARGLIAAAGGRMHAVNRAGGGARVEIELPVGAMGMAERRPD